MDFIMKDKTGEVGRVEVDTYYSTWEVAVINVSHGYRRLGYGNILLKAACAYADLNGRDLELVVGSGGAMTNEQLGAWYGRYGFEKTGVGMRRRTYNPKENLNGEQENIPHKVP